MQTRNASKTTVYEAVVELQNSHKDQLKKSVSAAALISEQCSIEHVEKIGLLFDQRFGTAELANEKTIIAKEKLDNALIRAEKANQKHNDTVPCISILAKETESKIDDSETRYIPFFHWSAYNKTLTMMLILFFIISMAGSVINTQVLLMTSQDPSLLMNPYKAWVIALIPMLLAMATKFLPNQLETEKNKQHYKRKLHVFTAGVGIFWLVSFSLLMDGFGSSGDYIDIPAIAIALEILRKLLTFAQILGELLAGLCIFTAIQDLFEHHQPSILVKNPDVNTTKKLVDECQPYVECCQQEHLSAMEYLDFVRVGRKAFINTQLEALISVKRRNQLINKQIEDL